jgi:hypothetical protein
MEEKKRVKQAQARFTRHNGYDDEVLKDDGAVAATIY